MANYESRLGNLNWVVRVWRNLPNYEFSRTTDKHNTIKYSWRSPKNPSSDDTSLSRLCSQPSAFVLR